MKRRLTVALAAAAIAIVPATAAVAEAHLGTLQVLTETIDVPTATDGAQVVIVHGVPDLEVDILVDGEAAFEGVIFTDVTVTELAAGSYDLGVAPAGSTDPVLSAEGVQLEAGSSYSVIAHLDADGDPTLTLQANVTDQGAGIQVFHAAAFGAVDVQPTDATGLEGVTNGQTAFIATGPGTVSGVGVAPAGETDAAIDLGNVEVPEDTSILAYAVGAPDAAPDEPADGVTEDDEVIAPENGVPAGSGGLADTGMPLWVLSLMVLGALALAVPVLGFARGRR